MVSDALRIQVTAKWQDAFTRLNRNQQGIAGLMSFAEAWTVATDILHPNELDLDPGIDLTAISDSELQRVKKRRDRDYTPTDVRNAFTTINSARRLPFLMETFLEDLRQQFYLVVRDIEQYTTLYGQTDDPELIRKLVLRLYVWFKAWAPLSDLGSTIYSAYTLAFQTHLFSSLPPSFAKGFQALIASTLEPAITSAASTTDIEMDTDAAPSVLSAPLAPPSTDLDAASAALEIPSPAADTPASSSTISTADPTATLFHVLDTLGLLTRFNSLLSSTLYTLISTHITTTYARVFTHPILPLLRTWMSTHIVPWMLLVYARGASSAEEARTMLQGVGARFDFHVCKTLCEIRISEIWDIILEYPDSMPALMDLKECLARVDMRQDLVRGVRRANRKRLLHPGAGTSLILAQYVATIRCLRVVDPVGVLLYKVADPIRRYLRERPDTIRCIVSNLVGAPDEEDGGGGGGDLLLIDENEPIQPLQTPSLGNEDYTDPNWEPEPMDAGPEFRTNKATDVLSTLVSIYDSRDVFVKELQVLLAQRLLMVGSGREGTDRVERERKNVEILKVRFGEQALQVCEVMLRDMSDSRRVDGMIQGVKPSTIHPTIISHHFWPALEQSSLVMPGQFQALQNEYSSQFGSFKPDKKLRWLPHLGTVSLSLELQDRTVDADVPPLEAALIELFSQKDIWTLDELISAVGLASDDRGAVLKAILTWIDLGVLKEEKGEEGVFKLLETREEPDHNEDGERVGLREELARQEVMASSSTADVKAVPSVQQQQAEQMKVYWKFVEGMLTNLGGLPIDKIQSMLRFAPGYDRTQEQLATFLEAARREGVVICKEGIWKLNK